MADKSNRMTLRFKLRNETKGAFRYQEVDEDNNPVEAADKYRIGSLYVRKHTFGETAPETVELRVTY